ncbi:tRNA (cmo5U34)-methyltransferase [Ruminococcaceae bacterium YRB3002]|nr:tRNA (cmo5U34)-methyltransferase [Ruminococcaceae bacterium YRB3002]
MSANDNSSAYDSGTYDARITSVLPYYSEYHKQVIDLVNTMGNSSPMWLDTGCGTGTLAMRALEAFPGARLTLCDPSEQMLDVAKNKLAGRNVRYFNVPSGELEFDNEFDIVTAIQCHHYLDIGSREQAVHRCRQALKDGGIFVAFENIRMETDEADEIAADRWAGFLAAHGHSPESIKMHLERRGTEVLPITVEQHLELLKKCSFKAVNVLWASYLQAGFWAIK